MRKKNQFNLAVSAIGLAAACLTSGCEPATTNSNAGAANTAANSAGANAARTNANSSTANPAPAGATIDAREPEQYQATITIRAEASGNQQQQPAAALPSLTANVARNGADKRMELTLPNGEKIVYLDRADKRLLISPTRKQYAEINQASVGMDVRQMLTPAQMIERAKSLKGVERVGEEQIGGRAAIKYRYAAATDTKTQAGQVQTESFFFVDKETGLPLRSETVAASGGSVQGMSNLKIITETTNIQTAAAPELFAEPTDYKKVAPEELRGQINALLQIAGALLGQMMQTQAPAAPTAPAASPAASPAS